MREGYPDNSIEKMQKTNFIFFLIYFLWNGYVLGIGERKFS